MTAFGRPAAPMDVDAHLAQIDDDLVQAGKLLASHEHWPDTAVNEARCRLVTAMRMAETIGVAGLSGLAGEIEGLLRTVTASRQATEPEIADVVLRGIEVMLCVARDTARRRAGMPAAALDQAVAQLYARVADVHKRTAGGGSRREMVRMTRRVAHDLNNLLQIISGNAELLTMDLAPAGAESEAASAIAEASQRAAELTRQLLASVHEGPSAQLSDR